MSTHDFRKTKVVNGGPDVDSYRSADEFKDIKSILHGQISIPQPATVIQPKPEHFLVWLQHGHRYFAMFNQDSKLCATIKPSSLDRRGHGDLSKFSEIDLYHVTVNGEDIGHYVLLEKAQAAAAETYRCQKCLPNKLPFLPNF